MDMYTYHVDVDTRKLSKIINAQFLMKIREKMLLLRMSK